MFKTKPEMGRRRYASIVEGGRKKERCVLTPF
jgi:hypothetical protein